MQPATKTGNATTVIGTVIIFFLTFAMNSLISSALATPQIAKGKPCTACHKGSPPSKSNVKK